MSETTKKQREAVVALLPLGYTSASIAAMVCCTVQTVTNIRYWEKNKHEIAARRAKAKRDEERQARAKARLEITDPQTSAVLPSTFIRLPSKEFLMTGRLPRRTLRDIYGEY